MRATLAPHTGAGVRSTHYALRTSLLERLTLAPNRSDRRIHGVSTMNGIERIANAFQPQRTAFMPYAVLGYPTPEASLELIETLVWPTGLPSRRPLNAHWKTASPCTNVS